jgi:hypothetical protein
LEFQDRTSGGYFPKESGFLREIVNKGKKKVPSSTLSPKKIYERLPTFVSQGKANGRDYL